MQPTSSQAEAFCRAMMLELEDQWTRARGHQERHPLREKIRQLEWIVERVAAGESLDLVLTQGSHGDDAVRCILCQELLPRWNQAKQSPRR